MIWIKERISCLKRHGCSLAILIMLVVILLELHVTHGGRYQLLAVSEPYVLRMDTRTGKITSLVAYPPEYNSRAIERGFAVIELK